MGDSYSKFNYEGLFAAQLVRKFIFNMNKIRDKNSE